MATMIAALFFLLATVATGERPFIIGVAGGTASGKTALTAKVVARLKEEAVSITQDAFYRDLTPAELADVGNFNFDAPGSVDFESCVAVLRALRRGEEVRIPDYDFVTNARRPSSFDRVVAPPKIVVFEGILALYDARLRDLYDLMIFVDVEADVRLARRIRRDIEFRGRDLDGVLRQYCRFVKPAFDEFCYPTKQHADVIVPRGAENEAAVDIIVNGIKRRAESLRRDHHLQPRPLRPEDNTRHPLVERQRPRRDPLETLPAEEGTPQEEEEEEEEERPREEEEETLVVETTELKEAPQDLRRLRNSKGSSTTTAR